jgi:hypothetical protein
VSDLPGGTHTVPRLHGGARKVSRSFPPGPSSPSQVFLYARNLSDKRMLWKPVVTYSEKEIIEIKKIDLEIKKIEEEVERIEKKILTLQAISIIVLGIAVILIGIKVWLLS